MATFEENILASLERIERRLALVSNQGAIIMAEIDDLAAEVDVLKSVQDGAVVVIHRLADEVASLVANATDLATLKVQVAAATQKFKDNAIPLADAVAANTEVTP